MFCATNYRPLVLFYSKLFIFGSRLELNYLNLTNIQILMMYLHGAMLNMALLSLVTC